MKRTTSTFRQIDAQKVIETVIALQRRIGERFPGSGLGSVVADLRGIAEETVARTEWIQRPHLPLRIAAGMLSLGIVALLIALLVNIQEFKLGEFVNFAQALDASISSVVFIGAAILFLVSCETRIKRARALKAIHELRSMAHIVDMHQLTKDPETYYSLGPRTATSPRRAMTPFELNRYLDYCSEALALISKVAALYVQGFQDAVLLDSVDDIEALTTGFSRKIWQKITLLETLGRALPGPPAGPEEPPATPPDAT